MNTEHDDAFENPYAAPRSDTTAESVEPRDMQELELRYFVGSKADYYLRKWRPVLHGHGRSAGFNWAAFFLTGLWLPYRKMYAATFIFFGIIFAESVLEELLFVVVRGREAPAALSNVVGLVAAIICGAYGNQWYLSHARRKISQARAEGYQDHALLEIIARRGGTSLWASLGMFALFLLVAIGALTGALIVLETP